MHYRTVNMFAKENLIECEKEGSIILLLSQVHEVVEIYDTNNTNISLIQR